MRNRIFACLITAATVLPSPASLAAVSDAEFSALREQMALLSQRLDDLERANRDLEMENARLQESGAQTAAAVAEVSGRTEAVVNRFAESAASASWTDRISIKGDFRYRYENIDEEFKDARNRSRVRARASIIADVSDDVQVGLGLASGGDDPVSTNQTLGGGGSTKGLNLDLAYFQWSGMENTKVIGGKFKNILYKPGGHGLLWDGDWNPEGFGIAWAHGDWFANAIGTWLESDSRNDSEFTYGLQVGLEKELGDDLELTAGISYFDIGTAGKRSFYGDADDFFGNSFDPATNTYLYNYEEFEVFADLAFSIGDQPASVFFDYVQNRDAPRFDTGYALGFKYGSAKSPGTWEFGYVWEDLETDATLGLLSDSDFGGGGTGVRGHIFKGSYAVARNWNANLTYFANKSGMDSVSRRDYDRLQLDLAFKY